MVIKHGCVADVDLQVQSLFPLPWKPDAGSFTFEALEIPPQIIGENLHVDVSWIIGWKSAHIQRIIERS